MDYTIDLERGKYICGACGKKYPMTYVAYSHAWMSRKSCPGIAWANFRRHLAAHEDESRQGLFDMNAKGKD